MAIVKLEEIAERLKADKLLDDREAFVYATDKSVFNLLGGAVGAMMKAVVMSVYGNVLHVMKANLDNSYGEEKCAFNIPEMQIIKLKTGALGGKFVFNYNGKKYAFDLPSKADKFTAVFG